MPSAATPEKGIQKRAPKAAASGAAIARPPPRSPGRRADDAGKPKIHAATSTHWRYGRCDANATSRWADVDGWIRARWRPRASRRPPEPSRPSTPGNSTARGASFGLWHALRAGLEGSREERGRDLCGGPGSVLVKTAPRIAVGVAEGMTRRRGDFCLALQVLVNGGRPALYDSESRRDRPQTVAWLAAL